MLGLVTIGQAPRNDVTEDLSEALSDVEWVEHGALDRCAQEEILAVRPTGDEPPLVTRTADGSSVRVGHTALRPLLERAFGECRSDGADAVLLMCTGHFDGLSCPLPLFEAEAVAQEAVASMIGGRTLGVINPVPDQSAEALIRWRRSTGTTVVGAWADPYTASMSEIVAAGREVVRQGAELIALDCFGYTTEMGRRIAADTGVEVVVTREVAVTSVLRTVGGAAMR